MAAFEPIYTPPTVVLVESASDLKSTDYFSKSDPYCRLSTRAFHWCTHVIQNNANPVWNSAFLVCLPSSMAPVISIDVYDSDSSQVMSSSDDFLGRTEFNLLELLNSNPNGWATTTLSLGGPKITKGSVTISVHRYYDVAITIDNCLGLRNADGMFGKSDPFCKLHGIQNIKWGKTQTIQNDLNPTFGERFVINPLNRLPLGGKLQPLTITVMDEDTGILDSTNDSLGFVQVPWKSFWTDAQTEKVDAELTGKKAKGTITYTVEVIGAPLPSDPPVPVEPEPEVERVRVPKTSSTAHLVSGVGFKIADCCDDVPDKFTMGLAWELTDGKNIDLDASCIVLNDALEQQELICFNNLLSQTGAIKHLGDEREGDEKGDDEQIQLDLSGLPESYKYLGFVVNSYSGEDLNQVKDCKCRLINQVTQANLGTFDLSKKKDLHCTAFLMCVLFKNGDDWFMHAIGEGANGKTAVENVDELQAFLKRTDLGKAPKYSEEKEPMYARIRVPEKLGDDRRMKFTTPSGGVQSFQAPADAEAGTALEVPVIAFYGEEG